MNRKGVYFDIDYPHIEGGVRYSWPYDYETFNEQFLAKKEEMGALLLENFRGYAQEFNVFGIEGPIPYMQHGEKGLALHMGHGGRWIEMWNHGAGYFLNGHNLDAYAENAAAFNIGSDIVEYLDESILAPRISAPDGDYVFTYPLPHGKETITDERFCERSVRNFYNLFEWPEFSFTNESDLQRVESEKGIIEIRKGMCVGKGFTGWDMPRASFIIAKLMYLSKN